MWDQRFLLRNHVALLRLQTVFEGISHRVEFIVDGYFDWVLLFFFVTAIVDHWLELLFVTGAGNLFIPVKLRICCRLIVKKLHCLPSSSNLDLAVLFIQGRDIV